MVRRTMPRIAITVFALLFSQGASFAATVTLRPSKDAVIYSPVGGAGATGDSNLASGKSEYLLAGRSGERRALRSLIAFDLSAQVPAGSTITSVTLSLPVNTPHADASVALRVHRLTSDWSEGTVAAPSGGGGGGPAAPGSVTWTARSLGTANWGTPGGDFAAAASASQRVGGSGPATVSAAGMVADVQAWLANPAANFGWMLKADDETEAAVRFASREGTPAPSLVIEFNPPGTGGGNVAPAFSTQPAGQSVAAGGAVTFTVVATGSPAPTLQWRRDGTAIANATNATLTLANVTVADAGAYTVLATNAAGTATSAAAQLNVTPPVGGTARLANLSVRTALDAGQTLIVGFAVTGGGSRDLLIRGVGPALVGFGLAGAMADPRLELYRDTTLVAQNDDWGGGAALSNAFAGVGAFAFTASSRDAALLQPIDGTRTVQLRGTGAGIVLLELYDTGGAGNARLINVSARNRVGTGDNVLICGFVVGGTGSRSLLVRAVGPTLAAFGVPGTLADPRIEVYRAGTAAPIAGNDNWAAALAPAFASVGAFDLGAGSRDAALVTVLTPGSYTVQVSGVANGTGEALVEIYELP